MKLEVGMYVRTRDGIIDKITIDYNGKCNNPNCNYKHVSCAYNYYDDHDIIKASFNIIDILEVKDIIEIDVIDEDNYSHILGINFIRIENERDLSNIKDMISNESARLIRIVTHQQFEQISYKIGE